VAVKIITTPMQRNAAGSRRLARRFQKPMRSARPLSSHAIRSWRQIRNPDRVKNIDTASHVPRRPPTRIALDSSRWANSTATMPTPRRLSSEPR
jgi:hypothetical protein